MKNYFILILLIAIKMSLYSQQDSQFLKNYNKLSFTAGFDKFNAKTKITNLPNTVDYHFLKFNSQHFGLNYTIFQKNNFNFFTGINIIHIRNLDYFKLDKSEIPYDTDYDLITASEVTSGFEDWQFNLPFTTEYIYALSNKFKLTFNGSFIIGFNMHGGGGGGYGISDDIESEVWTEIEYTNERPNDPIYFNTQIGAGMYFPFKKWMLKTNFFYNLALQNLYVGDYELRNLAITEDTRGSYKVSGNYFGAEITVFLKKKIK